MNEFDFLIEELKQTDSENKETYENAEMLAEIIDKIIFERKEKGYSQRELSDMCGMKQSALARIESLQVVPRLDTLIRIATKLNLKLILKSNTVVLPEIKIIVPNGFATFKNTAVASWVYGSKQKKSAG